MSRSKMQLNRKQIVVWILAVAGVMAIVYGVASILYWQNYQKDSMTHIAIKPVVFAALEPSSKDVKANTVALDDASTKLADSAEFCTPQWWVAWQTVISSVDESVRKCQIMAKHQMDTRRILEKIRQFLSDEEVIIARLIPLTKLTSSLTEKTWTSSINTWKKVSDHIQSYRTNGEYKPVLRSLQKQLRAVINAWNRLEKADKRENLSEYEQSVDRVDRAITDMLNVADSSDNTLDNLLKTGVASARKL